MARLRQLPVLLLLWRYVRTYLPVLLLMLGLLLTSTTLSLVQPFMYREAFDAIATGQAGDAAVLHRAVRAIVIGVVIGIVMIILEQAGSLILGWVETRVMRKASNDSFDKVQRLSTGYHVNEFAGSTSRKISRGIDSIESMMDRIWFGFLPAVFLLIGFIIALSFLAPLISLIMFVGMVISISLSVFFNSIHGKFQRWVDEQDTKMNGSRVDAISANALVKSFAAESREDARLDGIVAEWQRRVLRTWSVSTLVTLVQFIVLMFVELAVFSSAIYLWYRGELSASSFIVIVLYVVQMWGKLWDMGRIIRDYMKAVAHIQELLEVLELPQEVADEQAAKPLIVDKGEIVFDDVLFRYKSQNNAVFQHFSMHIKAGERIALVGHSGGGKSTFVKLLMRLYNVNEGSILIDGQDIALVTQKSLRENIALVPQDPILFHRTLHENIAYGRPDATMQEIEHAAKLAHAHEFIGVLPLGYETLVGERGVKLSGGERQRVAIARAMLADRPILVLDEATSSLDSISENYIQDALDHLMQGRTSIVIAHRLSTIKKADRILVIEKGSIVEEGSHEALLARKDGVYRQLYEMQAGGFIGE